jgi:holin-like protein
MIESITFLLGAQLVGEVIVRAVAMPVPGPVVGLIILALIMAWRGIPEALHETALGLLHNLSPLFVPAGVGIIRQADILAANWLALSVALVVSTLATLTVTALAFRWAQRRFGGAIDEGASE